MKLKRDEIMPIMRAMRETAEAKARERAAAAQ